MFDTSANPVLMYQQEAEPDDKTLGRLWVKTSTKVLYKANGTGYDVVIPVGTQGGVVIYGASGAATALAAGSSGQALVSAGAGANALWGSAGAIAFIEKKTLANTATTTFNTNVTSYDYLLLAFHLRGDPTNAGNTEFQLRFNGDATAGHYASVWKYGTTPTFSTGTNTGITLVGSIDGNLHEVADGICFIPRKLLASASSMGVSAMSSASLNLSVGSLFEGSWISGMADITSLTIATTNGNVNMTGELILYGLATA